MHGAGHVHVTYSLVLEVTLTLNQCNPNPRPKINAIMTIHAVVFLCLDIHFHSFAMMLFFAVGVLVSMRVMLFYTTPTKN